MKAFEIDFTNFEQTDSGTPPHQDILFGQKGKLKTIGTITKYTLTYDETVKVDKQGKKLPIPKWKVKTKTKTHLYEVVYTLDGQRNLFVVVNEEAPVRLAHKIEYKHFANDFKSLKSEGSLMELKSGPKPLFLGVYNAPTARKALSKAHEMLIEFIETGIDFGEKIQEYAESFTESKTANVKLGKSQQDSDQKNIFIQEIICNGRHIGNLKQRKAYIDYDENGIILTERQYVTNRYTVEIIYPIYGYNAYAVQLMNRLGWTNSSILYYSQPSGGSGYVIKNDGKGVFDTQAEALSKAKDFIKHWCSLSFEDIQVTYSDKRYRDVYASVRDIYCNGLEIGFITILSHLHGYSSTETVPRLGYKKMNKKVSYYQIDFHALAHVNESTDTIIVENYDTAKAAWQEVKNRVLAYCTKTINQALSKSSQTAPKQPQKSPEQVQLTWRLTDDCKIEYERIPLAGKITVDKDIEPSVIDPRDMVLSITYFVGEQQAGKPAKWHRYLAKATDGYYNAGLKQYKEYLIGMDGDSEQITWYEFNPNVNKSFEGVDEETVLKIGAKGTKLIGMFNPDLSNYENILNVINRWKGLNEPAPDPYPQYIPNLYRQEMIKNLKFEPFDKQDSFYAFQYVSYYGEVYGEIYRDKLYYSVEGTNRMGLEANWSDQGKLKIFRYRVVLTNQDVGEFFNVLGSYESKGWYPVRVDNATGYKTSKEAYAAAKQFIIDHLMDSLG